MAFKESKHGNITLSKSNEFVTVEVFQFSGPYAVLTLPRSEWDSLIANFDNGKN